MRIPLAWLNLVYSKTRTALAVSGVAFAVVLIFMQLGFLGSAEQSATLVFEALDFDVLVRSRHYLHLVEHEGETWSREMLLRAGKQRLAPVLMTALTSGIGLVPLAMAAGEPGKEILYPVATVIIGGLISSTLLEFLVRPALFWTFGRRAAARLIDQTDAETVLE